MIIRGLDADHDWLFGKGIQSYKFDQEAVMQNIQTRLLAFFNNCFFDKNAGIDWMRLLGTPGTQAELQLSCRSVILQSYGVVKINEMSVSVTNRRAILQFNLNTIFTSQFSANLEVV